MSGSTERADVQRVEAEAREWRKWATGEQKKPPHNLLAFTTDVLSLADALRAAEEALDKGRRFERAYQESLGATPTQAQWERLDSLQSAFIDAYVPVLAAASTEGADR